MSKLRLRHKSFLFFFFWGEGMSPDGVNCWLMSLVLVLGSLTRHASSADDLVT